MRNTFPFQIKLLKKYKMVPPSAFSYAQDPDIKRRLLDIETLRISEMNEAGVDLQVLSLVAPGKEQLDIEEAVAFSREVNDYVADIIMKHPERFAAFATLPIADPEKAVDELERIVKQYNFKGAMISGNYKGKYLDDPFFLNPCYKEPRILGFPYIYIQMCLLPPSLKLTIKMD
ncbi:amidohydrolase family protein [Vulcanisaeta sp. JCM 16159]|uniref:amidohydrolase family protein n=1 Tax=Vulcanisaeta sp. JCM 16159 TaxID=1295371 RepID=UPI000B17B08A